MRILHVSDVHCATQRLTRVLAEESYDLVAATGDLECVDTAKTLVEEARGRVIAVTGNMDNASVARILRDSGALLDGRLADVEGLGIVAGVGGLDPAGSLDMLERSLRGLDSSGVEVLLSHHPPRGVLDRTFIGIRIGLRELSRLVERLRPRLHLFGHVHEARGVEERGGTLFVNAGPLKRGYYAIIECTRHSCTAEPRRLA